MSLSRFNEESYGHFVTSKTFRNKRIFNDTKCCDIVAEDIGFYRKKLRFKLLGYCIMPDHLHLIVWWNEEKLPELMISKIIQSVKSHSGRRIVDYLHKEGRRGPLTSSTSSLGQGTQATRIGEYPRRRMSDQKYQIWQPSFYDFNVYSEKKLREKLDYIHWNPVRATLCKRPEDWQWSSYSFYEFGKQGEISINTL